LCAKPFFTVALSEIILSLQNLRVKELVKLRESPRRRRELSLFPIEGLREIEVGIDAERMFTEVYFCPSFFHQRGEDILLHRFNETEAELFELGKDAFAKASYRESPDGIIALAQTFDLQPSCLSLGANPLVLVLDEVEKPGNLGAVLRSAEAFGVDAVLLSDAVVDFFNPNVIRSSQGLSLRMPVAVG
jgi:TrmH family RNA methyltransferase